MFYDFRQNNSGGTFYVDSSVAQYVLIEANDADEANARAQEIGIYFNGVDDGVDCECCGDRWYETSSDGTEAPTLYGEPVESHEEKFSFTPSGEPLIHVYYLNGEQKTYPSK
jgi:hypothetical protein